MNDKHRVYGRAVQINTENTRAFYDNRAKRIAEMSNPYVSVLLGDQNTSHAEQWNIFEKSYILPELKLESDSRVLDIGCGIGRWAESVIPMCEYYCGTDFSAGMVQVAKERINFTGKEYSFHNLSFQELVHGDAAGFHGQFNRLIIGGVCMYINDKELPKCYEGLLPLLDKKCIMYLTETVAVKERLTLDECPSEALKATYDVIYRTPAEYNKYYEIFIKAGFSIVKQDFLPHLNNEKQFSETDRWYTILQR